RSRLFATSFDRDCQAQTGSSLPRHFARKHWRANQHTGSSPSQFPSNRQDLRECTHAPTSNPHVRLSSSTSFAYTERNSSSSETETNSLLSSLPTIPLSVHSYLLLAFTEMFHSSLSNRPEEPRKVSRAL